MANSATSKVIANWPHLVQQVTCTIDSAGVISTALAIDASPDEYWAVASTMGTDVVQPHIAFDTTNWELDFQATVENAGTIGTHVFEVFLKYYSQATGGIT